MLTVNVVIFYKALNEIAESLSCHAFPITCQALLNNLLSYVPLFTSCSVVSPRSSVPLESVLKKNEHLKKDLHVVL